MTMQRIIYESLSINEKESPPLVVKKFLLLSQKNPGLEVIVVGNNFNWQTFWVKSRDPIWKENLVQYQIL